MDNKFGGRKFFLAVVAMFAAIAGLFTGYLTEQSYLVCVGGILGLYGYQNLKSKSHE